MNLVKDYYEKSIIKKFEIKEKKKDDDSDIEM